jgi:hypothetical protein
MRSKPSSRTGDADFSGDSEDDIYGEDDEDDEDDEDEDEDEADFDEEAVDSMPGHGTKAKFSLGHAADSKRMKRMRLMKRSMSNVKGKLGMRAAKAKAKVKEAPDRAKEKAKAAAIVARFIVRRGKARAKRARQKARDNIGTAKDKARETLERRGPIGAAKAAASKVGGGMKKGVEKTKEAAKERIAGARALGTAVKRKARDKKEAVKERIENRGRPGRPRTRSDMHDDEGDEDDEWGDEGQHTRGAGGEALPGAPVWEAPMRQLLGVEYESFAGLVTAQAALEERLSPRLSVMEQQRQRLHFALSQLEQAMEETAPGGGSTSSTGQHTGAAANVRGPTPVSANMVMTAQLRRCLMSSSALTRSFCRAPNPSALGISTVDARAAARARARAGTVQKHTLYTHTSYTHTLIQSCTRTLVQWGRGCTGW